MKKCLPFSDYVKAELVDSGAVLTAFAAAAGAIYYISRSMQVYTNGLAKVEELRKAKG